MKLLVSTLIASILALAGGCEKTQGDALPESEVAGESSEPARVTEGSAETMAVAQEMPPLQPESAAQEAEQGEPAEPPATQATEEGDERESGIDPEEEAKRIAAAQRLLEEMLQAYQSAPALVDHVTLQQSFGARPGPFEDIEIRLGPGKDAEVRSKNAHVVTVDGFFYATRVGSGRYLKVPLQEDLLETSRAVLAAQPGMSVQLRFRYGRPLFLLLHSLSLGYLGDEMRISSYRRITDNEGRELEQLTLISGIGSAVVNVDPETKLVRTIEVDHVPPDAPVANFHIRQKLEFNPQVYDELPTPIEFDTTGKLEVRTWRQVLGAEPLDNALAIEEGKVVADFTLYTLTGRKVVLSELKGKPALLYFWSMNDVESRKNIHELEAYHEWLESTGQPATFYPICTLSRSPIEQRWEEAFNAWEAADLSLECLIDLEDELAESWGITTADALVVIDEEGRLLEVLFDIADGGVVDTLKDMTGKAVSGTSPAAAGG